jgi:hypothetical protein
MYRMQTSWWQYRAWKFVTDMNADGAFTPVDISHWAHWLLFMPGDAVIALVGPTWVGAFLGLTPGSFGGVLSALLSVALWAGVILLMRDLLVESVDPTYRQRQRELRYIRAQARRRRAVWSR